MNFDRICGKSAENKDRPSGKWLPGVGSPTHVTGTKQGLVAARGVGTSVWTFGFLVDATSALFSAVINK
jgi:hypothetical protein